MLQTLLVYLFALYVVKSVAERQGRREHLDQVGIVELGGEVDRQPPVDRETCQTDLLDFWKLEVHCIDLVGQGFELAVLGVVEVQLVDPRLNFLGLGSCRCILSQDPYPCAPFRIVEAVPLVLLGSHLELHQQHPGPLLVPAVQLS